VNPTPLRFLKETYAPAGSNRSSHRERTKWLKPSISVSRIGDSASAQVANASERRASSEKDDV
jgi:hypothetical protein